MNNIIRLMVMPCKPELHRQWAGVFEAKLGETIICRSRQPFVDGARALLAMGYDPEMVLVMRHATTGTDALKSKLFSISTGFLVKGQVRAKRVPAKRPDDRAQNPRRVKTRSQHQWGRPQQ